MDVRMMLAGGPLRWTTAALHDCRYTPGNLPELEANDEWWEIDAPDETDWESFSNALLNAAEAVVEARYKPLVEAVGIFNTFLAVAEAMEDQGEFEKPLTDHSVFASLHFGGGSIMLEIGFLREIRAALATLGGEGKP